MIKADIKLVTRLTISFSQLNNHKFKQNFQDTVNPLCSCGKAIESALHYLLRKQHYTLRKKKPLNLY